MTVGVKMAIGLASAAGGSCAVVVPMSLHTTTSTNESTLGSKSVETGKRTELLQLSMKECTADESQTRNIIAYGESNVQKICWKREGVSAVTGTSQMYSNLFKNQWGSKDLDWDKSENHNQWTKQCSPDTLKWAIVIQGVEGQYLGFCDDSRDNEIKFVKKVKENSGEDRQESWTISTCEKDCWEQVSNGVSGSPRVLEKEISNNWKKVTFYNS